jgi:O-antigen/teichoic acid export membrane protein
MTGIGLVVSAVAQLFSNLLLVAMTPSTVFADIAVTTFTLVFLAIAARGGIDRMFVGEVKARLVSDGHDEAAITAGSLLAGSTLLSLIALIATGVGPLAWVIDVSLSNPLTIEERWIVGSWLACDSLRLVLAEAHRASDRFVRAAMAGFGLRAPLFLVLLLTLWITGAGHQRTDVLAAALIASAVTMAVSLPTALTECRWTGLSILLRLARSLPAHASAMASTLSASLIGGADVWLVGLCFDSQTTARYSFAVTVVASLAIPQSATSGGLAPRLAVMLTEGSLSEAQRLSVRFVRLASGLAALGYLALTVTGEAVAVALGGTTYDEVTPLLGILGAGHILATTAGISGWVLIYARRYHQMSWITTVTATLGIALEWLAAGVVGSLILLAVASACATAAIHVCSAVVSATSLRIRTDVLARSK